MINEDDLDSKENREAFDRLIKKVVQASKTLEEYLKDLPLSKEEKEAILEYRTKLNEKKEENIDMGATKPSPSRTPVSPVFGVNLAEKLDEIKRKLDDLEPKDLRRR
jgi:hypothetical protein